MNIKDIKILIACEESQTVCKAFRESGFIAYSNDIQECSGGHPEWHIQQDVLKVLSPGDNGYGYKKYINFTTVDGTYHILEEKWDMIIAFPPCTHLAVSGAAWFKQKREDGRQEQAIRFFMSLLNADCSKIAVENPVNIISGGYIAKHFPHLQQEYEFPIKPTQIIQPYEFGDRARKKTCLWLKNLPYLQPTNIVEPIIIKYKNGKGTDTPWHMETMKLPPTERAKARSKTFPGIAKAMAEQWGNYLINEYNLTL